MSDSDKTTELDNYGVWVKKPPRTVSSDTDSTDSIIVENSEPIGDDGETALSADELANITGGMTSAESDSGETEISLDEFIDGGVFEGDDAGNAAPAAESEPEPEASDSGETEVSLDEFIDGGVFEGDDTASSPAPAASSPTETSASDSSALPDIPDIIEESSDITISDAPSVSDSPSLSDDGPIDIDLSFDDSDSAGSISSSSSVASAPVAEVPGSEEVDLSDFGVDFGDDSGSSSSSSASSGGNDGTEEVSLDEFGVDFSDDGSSGSSSSSESQATSEASSASSDGTEEVSLDEFGVDFSDDDSGASSAPTEPEQETISLETPANPESESVPSLTDDEPAVPEMTVSADDDDVGDISLGTAEPAAAQEQPVQTFSSSEQDSDDFDMDSILDSIEDENGNTSSLNDISGDSTDESEPEAAESPELSDSEPTVVDLDEPVFEETSVDIAEIPENSDTIPESDFIADEPPVIESEEPTLSEDNQVLLDDSEPLDSIEASESAESDFLEPVSTEIAEPAVTEAETDEPIPEEPAETPQESAENSESETSLTDTTNTTSTKETKEQTVEQDAEISSATNNILNQIASELSSLRSEITNLKTEFEELKNRPVQESPAITSEQEDFLAQDAEPESSGGFFGDDDGDDTIALSIDEMDGILNSVEMVPDSNENSVTPNDSESVESDENLDYSALSNESLDSDSIEEPILDDINTDVAEEAPESQGETENDLPEEILVPKSDEDILVDSDSTESDSDSLASEPLELEEPEADTTAANDEPFVFDDTESEAETTAENDDTTLSADELANITGLTADSGDSTSTETADESLEADDDAENETSDEIESVDGETEAAEDSEDTLSSDSINDILGDISSGDDNDSDEESGVSISEGELDNLLSSEAALSEANMKYLEEEESTPAKESSIPNDLQKEIKSVLAYMDQLLENLPEEKIAEFAQSEQFETYKKLFKELGLD